MDGTALVGSGVAKAFLIGRQEKDGFLSDSGFMAVGHGCLPHQPGVEERVSIHLLRTQTISSLSPHGAFSILSPSRMKGSFISLDKV